MWFKDFMCLGLIVGVVSAGYAMARDANTHARRMGHGGLNAGK